ncbi:type IV secretory system conjugative DNA transfer family protein [Catelliglobosispora koreensis]|uniref:type IV secretory system conjugative DNA transfer family protein n=1 Tax=Catelliglobosispora koreensis TaxID=129052 RepID=UPI00036E8BED|nr:type IV secretory system conjugative DNA transfer family protein [Catelliglobosispora koreensis]
MSANTTRVGGGTIATGSDALLIAIIGLAGFLSIGTWLSGQLAGLLFRASWPDTGFGDAFTIAFALPQHLADPKMAWPAAARSDLPGPAGFYIAMLLILALFVAAAVVGYRRFGTGGQRRGMASRQQLAKTMTASAVLAKAKRLRPNLTGKLRVEDVAVDLGHAGNTALYASLETSVLVLSAPRQGKTSQVIIPWLRTFPGAALVTSVRHDVLEATAMLRPGTAWVMDLTGDLSWPHKLRWSPIAGCEQFETARRRADTMIQVGKQGSDSSNSGFFAMTATNIMAGWLHTAALTGRTMRDVLDWSVDETDDTPVRLLRDAHGAEPGVLKMLDKLYRQPGTTRANLFTTVQTSTTALFGKAAQQVFCGLPSDSFDLDTFVTAGEGTIYLLVDENEVTGLAPLVTSFVRELLRTAVRHATASPNGRLDPPLGLILDEVTNVVPLPDLPKYMSTSAGFGIFITAVAQNLAALEERWGRVGRDQMWSNSTIKIALGGLSGDDLEEFSQLSGTYRETLLVAQRNRDGISQQATVVDRKTMSPEAIRTLDETARQALVIHATTPAVTTRMTRHFESRHAKQYAAAAQQAREHMGGPR